jgi:rhamnose utilization protein RhaD (predicted bifunctional aldolase and dehydrogenase)
VHTKRVPLWIPFDPATEDADGCCGAMRERRGAYRDEYRAYVERHATTTPSRPTPTRASC